jgi:SAM-dependent methyltransferase
VTGIDVSPGQIQRAKERIPTARFLVGDVTQMEFPAGSFRAIVAFYMMNHIPSDAHAAVYRKVATWLDGDGLFIANLPVRGGADGIEEEWLGVPMFFASLDVEQNLRAIQEAGLEILDSRLIPEIEVDPDEGTSEPQEWQWIVAKRGVTS